MANQTSDVIVLNNLGPRGAVIKLTESMQRTLGIDDKHSKIQIRLKTSPEHTGMHIIERDLSSENGFMLLLQDGKPSKRKAYIKRLDDTYTRSCKSMSKEWDKLPPVAILLLDQDDPTGPEVMDELDFDVQNMTEFTTGFHTIICKK